MSLLNKKNDLPRQVRPEIEKEAKEITQTPAKRLSIAQKEPTTPPWTAMIRQAQNGDKDAMLKLTGYFCSLLEYEADCLVKQNVFTEFEDAKSEVTVTFLEFITNFSRTDVKDAQIPGLFKKYLHDTRINLTIQNQRHSPSSYPVDFEKELEENSPFARFFPRCELQADREMERTFLKRVLEESMHFLTKKEETAVKKIYLENKPPSLAAKEMHCSERYIRKLKQRSLFKMRRYLESRYPSLTS